MVVQQFQASFEAISQEDNLRCFFKNEGKFMKVILNTEALEEVEKKIRKFQKK